MPHTAAKTAIVVKRNGTGQTSAMSQLLTEHYLKNVIGKERPTLHPCLTQALNDVFNGTGKASGDHRYAEQAVLHASSGNIQRSITLFYYMSGTTAHIFAMGEHETSSSYLISHYGQHGTSFKERAVVRLG